VLGRGDIGGREDKEAWTSTALQNRQAETIPYHVVLDLVCTGYVPDLSAYNNIDVLSPCFAVESDNHGAQNAAFNTYMQICLSYVPKDNCKRL